MQGFRVTQYIVRKGACVTQAQLNSEVLNFPYICLSHLWSGTVSMVYQNTLDTGIHQHSSLLWLYFILLVETGCKLT